MRPKSASSTACTPRATRRVWLTHCYGMVGVGRENDENSGGGTELYVIIGHIPRNLDRQLTMLGRVVQGMEIMSPPSARHGRCSASTRRRKNTSTMPTSRSPQTCRRPAHPLEIMRTDSESFATLVNSRRWRKDDFYKNPVGRIGLCNVTVPVQCGPFKALPPKFPAPLPRGRSLV